MMIEKPRTLRGELYSVRERIKNRLIDAMAIAVGYCNHCPWNLTPGVGGYSFWRCALPRGHDGLHRARNYVWTDDGMTDYLPVSNGQPFPSQPWDRSGIHTRRQSRQLRQWMHR